MNSDGIAVPRDRTQAIFASTGIAALGNSSAESSLAPVGQGTLVLPTNFLKSGSLLQVRLFGYFAAEGTGVNFTFRLKINGVTVANKTITPIIDLASKKFFSEFDLFIPTSGTTSTCYIDGRIKTETAAGLLDSKELSLVTSTVNTTIANTIAITGQYASASESDFINVLSVRLTRHPRPL